MVVIVIAMVVVRWVNFAGIVVAPVVSGLILGASSLPSDWPQSLNGGLGCIASLATFCGAQAAQCPEPPNKMLLGMSQRLLSTSMIAGIKFRTRQGLFCGLT